MPLTNYALDNFISQQLSELTEYNALEVSSRYPQKEFWVSNFSLNSIFGGTVSKEDRIFSFFFLRRVEAAFTEYEYACKALGGFISSTPKSSSLYFRTLHHFEMAISMMWQAYDFEIEKSGTPRFAKNDGSNYQRLNGIYNVSRHFNPSDLSAQNIHAIWLTNDGVKTENLEISYSETASFLIELGDMADEFSKAGK
ncbi:MAG: hypothetical protein L6300_10785 [Syntrophaceae bacterium]|nr:hypothetical protein [Syntrophaceae bacterium]